MSIIIRLSTKQVSIKSLPVKNSLSLWRQLSQQSNGDNKNLQPSKHYDIIIAGGGLVGTALACGISKDKVLSEKNVLLLESAPPFKGFAGGQYGNRVSAINHGSIELFKSIGAWDKISETRYKPVKQMQVWDASSDAMITFNQEDFSDNVACIIENDLMLDAIYTQLKAAQNVTVLNQSMIGRVDLRMGGIPKNVVNLKNGDTISCDLLKMDTYRMINRELTLNNQELRNALNKLKYEVTYLNRQLLDQREQFNRFRESIASNVEKKFHEIMALIYPEKFNQTTSSQEINKINNASHRQSCSNVTAADPLKGRRLSRSKDLMVDANMKSPVPKIIVHRDCRISVSPTKRSKQTTSEIQMPADFNVQPIIPTIVVEKESEKSLSSFAHNTQTESDKQSSNLLLPITPSRSGKRKDQNSSLTSHILSTEMSSRPNSDADSSCNKDENSSFVSNGNSSLSLSNKDLNTINEELSSVVDLQNETLTDATINNLLDAPCSTPYNRNNLSKAREITMGRMRVRIQKMSADQLENLWRNKLKTSDFEINSKQRKSTSRNAFKHSVIKKAKEERVKSSASTRKTRNNFKENKCSDSESLCSEDESCSSSISAKSLRPRKKTVSLKEPNLVQKLRNTTNLKL